MSTHNTFLRRNEKYSSISICKCTLSRVMMNTEVRQKINTQALLLKFHFFFTFFHSNLFSAFLSTKYFCHFLCMSMENDCCHDNKCKWRTDRTVTLKKIENWLGVSRTLKTHACKKSMKTFRWLSRWWVSRWCHLNVFQLNIYHCHGN